MACRLEHGVLELVLLGQGHHPKWSHPQQRRDVRLSLLTASSTRPHLLRFMLTHCRHKSINQCSPASPPIDLGSPVATLSCDSAASAPCGRRGATPPLPAISTWRVNPATPAAAAVVLLAVAAVVAAAASRAAGAEVEGQWNLWELTHCLLPLHSSAEAQNSLLCPHPAEPANGSNCRKFMCFQMQKALSGPLTNLMWIRARLLTLSPFLSHSSRRCH